MHRSYAQMVDAANQASFRHALWQMGEAIADLFSEVVGLLPELHDVAESGEHPTWAKLNERWKAS